MIEPFSIISGALGATGAAMSAGWKTYEFIKGIKEAPESISRLATDLVNVNMVLGSLSSSLNAEGQKRRSSIPSHLVISVQEIVQSCADVFNEIQRTLCPFVDKEGKVRKAFFKRLKWEAFEAKDAARLQRTLMHYKITLDLACNHLILHNTSQTHDVMLRMRRELRYVRQNIVNQEHDTILHSLRGTQPIGNSFEDADTSSAYSLPLRRFLDETESILSSEDMVELTEDMAISDNGSEHTIREDPLATSTDRLTCASSTITNPFADQAEVHASFVNFSKPISNTSTQSLDIRMSSPSINTVNLIEENGLAETVAHSPATPSLIDFDIQEENGALAAELQASHLSDNQRVDANTDNKVYERCIEPEYDKAAATPLLESAHISETTCEEVSSVFEALCQAVEGGEIKEVERCLDSSDVDLDERNEQGYAPLHLAVYRNNYTLVKLLLEDGANPRTRIYKTGVTPIHGMKAKDYSHWHDNSQFPFGDNRIMDPAIEADALHIAAWCGQTDIAQLLIAHGVLTDLQCEDYSWSYWYCAVRRGHNEILKLLIPHNLVQGTCTPYRMTPFLIGAYADHVSTVKLLLDRGPTVHETDSEGCTALHLVALNKALRHSVSVEMARSLVEKGLPIETKNDEGCTALHSAAEMGRLSLIRFLLGVCANPAAKDSKGMTPLHFAARYAENEAAVAILITAGAAVNEKVLLGSTPLHYASEHNARSAQVLIEHGAHINSQDIDLQTPLHRAAQYGSKESIRLLLAFGAVVDSPRANGETPLHFALYEGKMEAAEVLLEYGANLSAKDNAGYTAVHEAAEKGNEALLRFLVARNVSLDTQCEEGRTALHLAVKGGHTGLVRILTRHGAKTDVKDCYGYLPIHMATTMEYGITLRPLLMGKT